MDTSKTYIKMCQEAKEIQSLWATEYQSKYDCVFVRSFQYYKRSCKGSTSEFKLKDTAKENPSWVAAHNGIRGIEYVSHSCKKQNFSKIDKTFPDTDCLVELDTVRNPLLDEQWLPVEWLVWLPRQDQLQDMVKAKGNIAGHYIPYALVLSIVEFVGNNITHQFDSMEQLWMAFVMKEKYNKVWNGETWEISQ
jgi:hypothetical protein